MWFTCLYFSCPIPKLFLWVLSFNVLKCKRKNEIFGYLDIAGEAGAEIGNELDVIEGLNDDK